MIIQFENFFHGKTMNERQSRAALRKAQEELEKNTQSAEVNDGAMLAQRALGIMSAGDQSDESARRKYNELKDQESAVDKASFLEG